MRIRPIDWIIHGFALMHAATTILCTLSGMPDSMLLTLLTMALARTFGAEIRRESVL